jgi:hypothetical protein
MRRSSHLASTLALALVVGTLTLVTIGGAAQAQPQTRVLVSRGSTVPTGTALVPGGVDRPELPGSPDADALRGSTRVRPYDRAMSRTVKVRPSRDLVTPGLPVKGGGKALISSFHAIDHFEQRFANDGNQWSLEPPDQGLCVGNGFVVETVNTVMRVYDADGGPLSDVVDLNTFYGYPAAVDRTTFVIGPQITDPSCLYDRDTNRFFMVVLTLDVEPETGAYLGSNHLDIAVSQTGSPLKAWTLYSIAAQDDGTGDTPDHACIGPEDVGTGPCIGDYPHIGLDANGFYVTTNEYSFFGDQYTGVQLYAMSKAQLAAGETDVPYRHFESLQVPELEQAAFTLRAANAAPSQHDTEHGGTVYFLSSTATEEAGETDAFSDTIVLWALTGTDTLGSADPQLRLRHVVMPSLTYGVPPVSRQKAGSTPLQYCLNQNCFGDGVPPIHEGLKSPDSGDSRMMGAFLSQGVVWGVLDTLVLNHGSPRAGVAYVAVAPAWRRGLHGTMLMQGLFTANNANVTYPSIAVNAKGRGIMGFSLMGPNYYPSAAFATIALGEPPTAVRMAAAGLGPDDGFTGTFITAPDPRVRWGDYGYAALGAGGSFWIASEYVGQTCTFEEYTQDTTCGGTRSAYANWGTRISHVDA